MSGKDTDFAALVQGRAGGRDEKSGPVLKECQALVKSIDAKNRRITALASTANVDRDGDIIEPEAFREWLPVYMKNPVVLTTHQHRLETGQSSVIANVVDWGIDKNGLTVVIEFHDITGLAEEYWQLYSQKKQRAFSVGFTPRASEDRQVGGEWVRVYTEVEMIEISCVPVGSNREALSRSKLRKADFVAAKKDEHEDEKILAELRAENPDFDELCQEFADALNGDDIARQAPAKKPSESPVRSLAALLLKLDRELAAIFGVKGPYQRYLGYIQATSQGLSVGYYRLDEVELYKAVESGDIEIFAEVVNARIEVVKSKGKAIAVNNNKPDFAAIVSGVG